MLNTSLYLHTYSNIFIEKSFKSIKKLFHVLFSLDNMGYTRKILKLKPFISLLYMSRNLMMKKMLICFATVLC